MTDIQKAQRIADILLEHYEAYQRRFETITLHAEQRYAQREWRQMYLESVQRLELYKTAVQGAATALMDVFPAVIQQPFYWEEIKANYEQRIAARMDMEICQTWFNSVFRKLFQGQSLHANFLFVHSGFKDCRIAGEESVYTTYHPPTDWSAFLKELLASYFPDLSFMHLDMDIAHIISKLKEQQLLLPHFLDGLQVHKTLFYRNKAVYIIGRFLSKEGTIPFVLPIIHDKKGLYVDACIVDSDYLRIIFSYTRAYFLVHTPIPSLTVAFLLSIMPGKDLAEVYNSIGYPKHGKTEQYRLLLDELSYSEEQFVEAPGIRGLVMTVFTLPSYNMVFKAIRDAAEPPKETSRAIVEHKYRMVKKLDRVGRMADTHEYAYFSLPKHRFAPKLLEELQNTIPSQLQTEGNNLIFKHLYTERKSTPLNIILEEACMEDALIAALDYGQAIKEMAAANIFPGDMLTKNFGVTRHGRCIFYDYDEIVLLTQCNFRDKPKAETYEQIYAPKPWYDIGPDDIFPEEFRFFMIGREDIREEFDRRHGELYQASWWRNMQEKIKNGEFLHTFPYPNEERFYADRVV